MPNLDYFEMKRGDTHKPIEVQFTMEEPGLPEDEWPSMDCTDAVGNPRFLMRPVGQVGPASGVTPAAKVDTDGTWIDKPSGRARYDWLPADVDTAGNFWAEFQSTFPGGHKATAPSGERYITVVIGADLGG